MEHEHQATRPRSAAHEAQRADEVLEAPRVPVQEVDPRLAAVGAVVVRWEKLRVAYNLLLGLWTVLLTLPLLFRPWLSFTFLDIVFVGAIVANAAFTAAPLLESYITWFVGPNRFVSPVLFSLGTLFTMLLAAATVFALPI
ncbi:MAG: hypothetical protein H6736_11650 [Alphaproteobacteria bacterium]|nr:hypothetical protein [Alphaproteobacteria bacterium]MCB9692457.1 hypothetical protein [Alphaproteobacteria bacterium]